MSGENSHIILYLNCNLIIVLQLKILMNIDNIIFERKNHHHNISEIILKNQWEIIYSINTRAFGYNLDFLYEFLINTMH